MSVILRRIVSLSGCRPVGVFCEPLSEFHVDIYCHLGEDSLKFQIMRWLIKDLSAIHYTTMRFLRKATPKWKDDYMAEAASKSYFKKDDYIAVALFQGDHLLGWAMLDVRHTSAYFRTYIFVKEKCRRKGYGTSIIRKAKEVARRRGREIRVCPWDYRSKKFFRAVNITKSEVAHGYSLQ